MLLFLSIATTAEAGCRYRSNAAHDRVFTTSDGRTVLVETGMRGVVQDAHVVRDRVLFTMLWDAGVESGPGAAAIVFDIQEVDVPRGATTKPQCE